MSDDLKPCPFCGNAPSLTVDEEGHFAYCRTCGADGPSGYDRLGDAVAAWNTRPGEEALRQQRDEARAEAVMLREARNAWVVHSEAERSKSEAEILRLQRAHAEWVKRADEEVDALRVETKRLGAERDEARVEVERLRGGGS